MFLGEPADHGSKVNRLVRMHLDGRGRIPLVSGLRDFKSPLGH
jgi:hypothetical protein